MIVKNVLYSYLGNDKNVIIPDNVTAIGVNAFAGCKNLVSVTISDSVIKRLWRERSVPYPERPVRRENVRKKAYGRGSAEVIVGDSTGL